MIDSPKKLAKEISQQKNYNMSKEMQLLRPYCDKMEENQLYDVHNLSNFFGLPSEISSDALY